MTHQLSKIRIEQRLPGRISDGEYIKPTYVVTFDRNGIRCCVPMNNNGKRRPLGRDLLAAMQPYLKRHEVTEEALFDAEIRD